MGNQSKNDILSEQRKARKDFIELKKMQHGEMDAGPKPSEVAIVPKTPVEKLKNIWFHDKWLIIGIAITIILVSVLVAQCAGRTDYDLEVVLFAHSAVTDENNDNIADYLEKHCSDLNGDGEVNIQIINCSYNPKAADSQYRYTMSTKLQALIAADQKAILYITDSSSYEYLNGLADSELLEEPVALSKDFYDNCNANALVPLPENLQIACRKISDTAIEKSKDVEEFYKASQKILDALKINND